MKSFHQSVRCWMVRRGEVCFHTPRLHQLSPDFRRKLTASVSGDGRWYAERRDQSVGEGVEDRFG